MSGILTLVLVSGLYAAPGSGHGNDKAPAADSSAMTFVTVQNDRAVPLTVFVESRLGETELGLVAAHSTKSLRIRDNIAVQGQVDFILDPRGEANEETGYLPITPGSNLKVQVPNRW